jgi:hypothetical protein
MPVFSLNGAQSCEKCYIFRIGVGSYTSGSITVEVGNGDFTSVKTVATITADGNYDIDINFGAYECTTFNSIRITLSSPTTAIYQVQGFFVADSCADNFCSRCFEVTDNDDCLVELSWTNGRNFAGIEYAQLNYVQSVWVKGELNNANYPIENNVFRFGNGDTILTYGRRIKTMQLALKELP